MAGKVLQLDKLITPDQLACRISEYYIDWEARRQEKVREWKEVQQYIYATDTTKTSNSKLPWNNKTTIPKLCQIRDNLFANYMASLFPKRKWLMWEGSSQVDEEKSKVIEDYMGWVIDRNEFYDEIAKLVLDYIDYGNVICTTEWVDRTNTIEENGVPRTQVGYVGPVIRRISPLDIVINPIAPSFTESPKIIRSIVSLGEVKEMIERNSNDPTELEDARQLYQYMKDLRYQVGEHVGNINVKDDIYYIQGFDSYRAYLESNYVEILTFYGDIYDENTDTFLRNQVIKVIDRHKVLSKNTHPSFFGTAPIFHAGWRVRPDNLWAMGPLDNLVGMQYRIDHLENIKADVFDLVAFPPLKIKGYVEDFEWAPFERIYTGDDGDVTMMSPDVQAMQADTQIAILEAKMEEMAGSPKEAMGFRTPGEKTMYEVQRLENAAGRVFQNKIAQFERQIVENLLNVMLELSRRNMTNESIRVFDDEFKVAVFKDLTPQDITGNGRLKPVAARHFAEQANLVQNINNFFQSAAGQDQEVKLHFSSLGLAQLFENLLDIEDFNIVQPYIRLTEQADAQRLMVSQGEQVAVESQTPSGLYQGDADPDEVEQLS